MAETSIKTYIFGVIMTMFFIVGGISLFSMLKVENPNIDANDRVGEFNRTFNQLDEVSSNVNSLESTVQNTEGSFGVFGVLNALILGSWQTLKLIGNSFGFMDGVFAGLSNVFGVPAWIPLIIGLLITTLLVFAIYKMIFQTE